MLTKTKLFISSHRYAISLVCILWLLIAISLIIGSLLQFHWGIWTYKTFSSSRFIIYPTIVVLTILLGYFIQWRKNKKELSEKEKSLFPYHAQKVPKNDGKAFAQLFAYGTAISRGEEHLDIFIRKFRLTEKEQEVMRLLLCSDATIKDLSHDLMVSERVCQRHLTSIYEKTGTKSRLSLLMKFYE